MTTESMNNSPFGIGLSFTTLTINNNRDSVRGWSNRWSRVAGLDKGVKDRVSIILSVSSSSFKMHPRYHGLDRAFHVHRHESDPK